MSLGANGCEDFVCRRRSASKAANDLVERVKRIAFGLRSYREIRTRRRGRRLTDPAGPYSTASTLSESDAGA